MVLLYHEKGSREKLVNIRNDYNKHFHLQAHCVHEIGSYEALIMNNYSWGRK